jgi:hypothetical protein
MKTSENYQDFLKTIGAIATIYISARQASETSNRKRTEVEQIVTQDSFTENKMRTRYGSAEVSRWPTNSTETKIKSRRRLSAQFERKGTSTNEQ